MILLKQQVDSFFTQSPAESLRLFPGSGNHLPLLDQDGSEGAGGPGSIQQTIEAATASEAKGVSSFQQWTHMG